jgi:hypothetical protein
MREPTSPSVSEKHDRAHVCAGHETENVVLVDDQLHANRLIGLGIVLFVLGRTGDNEER